MSVNRLLLQDGSRLLLQSNSYLLLQAGGFVNVDKSWRGAVEPAQSGPSGNEAQSWRGGVEPTGVILYSLTVVSVESASEVSTPSANQIVGALAVSVESQSELTTPGINAGTATERRRIVTLTGSAN